jgi:uncharacterized protein
MKYVLMGLIRLYQIVLSPLVNWRGPVCKYHPSCSHFGYEAVKTHGAFKGGGMTAWRVLRCNPFGSGGYDPVPPKGESRKTAREARNLSEAEQSSPCGDTQTSDRVPEVGVSPPARMGAVPQPDRTVARSDQTNLRGA